VKGTIGGLHVFFLSLVFDHILDRLSIGLGVKDMLDGGLNFIPWKEWITLIIEEIEVTAPIDATLLIENNKKDFKAMMLTLDTVMDHIVSHISG
jgi:hypothetical protein